MRIKVFEFKNREEYEEQFDFECTDEKIVVIYSDMCVCADLFTNCKSWKTALRRFFSNLEPYPEFDGWYEDILESCKNGYFSDKETYCNGNMLKGGFFWEVTNTGGIEDCWYICLNVHKENPDKKMDESENAQVLNNTQIGETEKEENAMNKKYILTDMTKFLEGKTLHRIQAIKDFGDVHAGDLGGWIEGEWNLSHEGNCWCYDEAEIMDNANVIADAIVKDLAVINGNAVVTDSAVISDSALITEKAVVCDSAQIGGFSIISGKTQVFSNAIMHGNIPFLGDARIGKNAYITCKEDYFTIENVLVKTGNSINHITFTFYLGIDKNIYYAFRAGNNGQLQVFEEWITEMYGNSKMGQMYYYLIEYVKLRLKQERL